MKLQAENLAEFPDTELPPSGKLVRPRICVQSLLLILLSFAVPVSLASAIHEAARTGDLERVQRLIVKGLDVNAKSNRDETPLIVAALAGQGEIASYLLQRGADIDARTSSGLTSLHAAAYAGYDDIVRLLVARGATIDDAKNSYGVTPLHLAAEENHIATVSALLSLGASVSALESNGYSAVSRAGWREHWDVVDALLAKGAGCQPAEKVGDWLYQECSKRARVH